MLLQIELWWVTVLKAYHGCVFFDIQDTTGLVVFLFYDNRYEQSDSWILSLWLYETMVIMYKYTSILAAL